MMSKSSRLNVQYRTISRSSLGGASSRVHCSSVRSCRRAILCSFSRSAHEGYRIALSFAFRNGSCDRLTYHLTDFLSGQGLRPMFSSACLRFKHGLGGRIRSAAMEQNRPEFESLSDRALLEFREPDNFNTFVSSPLTEVVLAPESA